MSANARNDTKPRQSGFIEPKEQSVNLLGRDDWRPIETAPRDGTIIRVTDHETFTANMLWNAAGSNALVSTDIGIWEDPGGAFTWCEDQGFGPTHWQPAHPVHGRDGR